MSLGATFTLQEQRYPRRIDRRSECFYRTFIDTPFKVSLSKAIRLMGSVNELRKEVVRFSLMRTTIRSPFPRDMLWTSDKIQSALENARRARVPENCLSDSFIWARSCGNWEWYLQRRRMRHAWAEFFRSKLDWCTHYGDLSESLERLFERGMEEKGIPPPITVVGRFCDNILRIKSAKEPKMVEVRCRNSDGNMMAAFFFPAIVTPHSIKGLGNSADMDSTRSGKKTTVGVRPRLVPADEDQVEEDRAKRLEEGRYSLRTMVRRGDGTLHRGTSRSIQPIPMKRFNEDEYTVYQAFPGSAVLAIGEETV